MINVWGKKSVTKIIYILKLTRLKVCHKTITVCDVLSCLKIDNYVSKNTETKDVWGNSAEPLQIQNMSNEEDRINFRLYIRDWTTFLS